MSAQSMLFHESIEDALLEAVMACGGRKRFASELWPEKSPRDAHNLIDACLNPARREKFSFAQLVYIAKRSSAVGCHAVMNYMAMECGYEVKPIQKSEEQDRLITAVESTSKQLAAALAALERLQKATA